MKPDTENKNKFLRALEALRQNPNDIVVINKLKFTKAQTIFLGEEPLRIDFLTKVNLMNFDEAWIKKSFLDLKDIKVPVIDYDHLILTKLSTGRTKDKLDLEELQKINKRPLNISLIDRMKRLIRIK